VRLIGENPRIQAMAVNQRNKEDSRHNPPMSVTGHSPYHQNIVANRGVKTFAEDYLHSLLVYIDEARIPARNIAAMQSDIESLALSIARASGENAITELSRQAAEAQVDILRVRKVRACIFATETSHAELEKKLASLERYERRAFSRRKRAFQLMQRI
jgi:hypothetical protein